MSKIEDELTQSFRSYKEQLKSKIDDSFINAENFEEYLFYNYLRQTSLEVWRSYILDTELDQGSHSFFVEAQNDCLLSHFFAWIGSWRPSLIGLRSAMENIFHSLYFKDHQVELKKWESGSFKISMNELINYIKDHPDIKDYPSTLNCSSEISKEYDKLSKAVHASAVSFRMTDFQTNFPSLMYQDSIHYNQWQSREKSFFKIINMILILFYKEHLQGSKLPELRQILYYCLPSHFYDPLLSHLNIRIISPS